MEPKNVTIDNDTIENAFNSTIKLKEELEELGELDISVVTD